MTALLQRHNASVLVPIFLASLSSLLFPGLGLVAGLGCAGLLVWKMRQEGITDLSRTGTYLREAEGIESYIVLFLILLAGGWVWSFLFGFLGIWSLLVCATLIAFPNPTTRIALVGGGALFLVVSGVDYLMPSIRRHIHEYFHGRFGAGILAYNITMLYLFAGAAEELVELIRRKWNPIDIIATPLRIVWDAFTLPKYFISGFGRSPVLQGPGQAHVIVMALCFLNVWGVCGFLSTFFDLNMHEGTKKEVWYVYLAPVVIYIFRISSVEESSAEMQSAWLRFDPTFFRETNFRFYKESAVIALLILYYVLGWF